MMGATCATGSAASTAQGWPVGGQKQLVHLLLQLPDTQNGIRDPSTPLRLKLPEFGGNGGHRALPKLLSLPSHHAFNMSL